MPFHKGFSGNVNGRPKGAINKTCMQLRETITAFFENNFNKVVSEIESLLPPEIYIFIEKNDRPGTYEMKSKEYNQEEYLQFCKGVRKQGKIITFVNAKGCEPLKEH